MAAPARRAQPGEPLAIPAAVWNDLVAMLRERGGDGAPRPAGEGAGRGGLVLVRNTSGQDVDWLGILGVDGVVYPPGENETGFLGQPVLDGKKPTEDHRGRFVVVLEPVAAGGIARAVLMGVTPVLVNVTDEDHGWADVADGQAGYLESGIAGAAQILWKEAGTGTKWAVVRVGLPSSPLPPGTEHLQMLWWNETDEQWELLNPPVSEYMVLQRLPDDEEGARIGWDWVRAH